MTWASGMPICISICSEHYFKIRVDSTSCLIKSVSISSRTPFVFSISKNSAPFKPSFRWGYFLGLPLFTGPSLGSANNFYYFSCFLIFSMFASNYFILFSLSAISRVILILSWSASIFYLDSCYFNYLSLDDYPPIFILYLFFYYKWLGISKFFLSAFGIFCEDYSPLNFK